MAIFIEYIGEAIFRKIPAKTCNGNTDGLNQVTKQHKVNLEETETETHIRNI